MVMYCSIKKSGLIAGLLGLLLGLGAWSAQAAALGPHDVEVLGLFKDAVMLTIDGEKHLLKVDGQAVAGVSLVSSNSQAAVLEYNGQQQTLYLSEKVSSVFNAPENVIVSIARNNQGQYKTTGNINGVPVSYLVDTGATIMAMSESSARNLGIDYQSGQIGEAVTAGGRVKSWRVIINTVQVGQISRLNVEAAILAGDHPLEILLGMTFLSQVSMQESDGVLMLMSKF